jgi:DNA-3-methyladenine glycosylase
MEWRARVLPRAFFARDSDVVARQILGHVLVHEVAGEAEPRVGQIVEAEAYFGPPAHNRHLAARARRGGDATLRWVANHGDPAAHSFRGETERNRVMFGEAGFAYVYFIYGAHECMNVSTGRAGDAQAVLLRAVAPVAGLQAMRVARGRREPEALGSGPGKLTEALGISRAMNGHDLTKPPLFFARGTQDRPSEADVARGPRVGISAAAHLPLRFWIRGNPYVSVRRGESGRDGSRGRAGSVRQAARRARRPGSPAPPPPQPKAGQPSRRSRPSRS